MKYIYEGSLGSFKEQYEKARDSYNKDHPNKYFELQAFVKGNNIEIGVERSGHSGGYWFESPMLESNNQLILEGEIKPEGKTKLRWFDWIMVCLMYLIFWPFIFLIWLITWDNPIKNKKERIKRLNCYLCDYLNCIQTL